MKTRAEYKSNENSSRYRWNLRLKPKTRIPIPVVPAADSDSESQNELTDTTDSDEESESNFSKTDKSLPTSERNSDYSNRSSTSRIEHRRLSSSEYIQTSLKKQNPVVLLSKTRLEPLALKNKYKLKTLEVCLPFIGYEFLWTFLHNTRRTVRESSTSAPPSGTTQRENDQNDNQMVQIPFDNENSPISISAISGGNNQMAVEVASNTVEFEPSDLDINLDEDEKPDSKIERPASEPKRSEINKKSGPNIPCMFMDRILKVKLKRLSTVQLMFAKSQLFKKPPETINTDSEKEVEIIEIEDEPEPEPEPVKSVEKLKFSNSTSGHIANCIPNLESHIRTHTVEKSYTCPACAEEFNCQQDRIFHQSRNHPTMFKYQCDSCNLGFPNQKDYKNHVCAQESKQMEVRIPNPVNPPRAPDQELEMASASGDSQIPKLVTITRFACLYCPRTFGLRRGLHIHQTLKHNTFEQTANASTTVPQYQFTCPHCPRSFSLRKGLKVHKQLKHQVKEFSRKQEAEKPNQTQQQYFYCKYCPKVCSSKRGISVHQSMKHTRLGLYEASKNSSQIPQSESDYHPHTTSDKRLFKFRCHHCKQIFSALNELQDHVKSHAAASSYPGMKIPHQFQCLDCSESFSSLNLLTVHNLTHSQSPLPPPPPRLSYCKQCDGTFTSSEELARHEINHGLEKPATCQYTKNGSTHRYLFTVHDPPPPKVSQTQAPWRYSEQPPKQISDVLKVQLGGVRAFPTQVEGTKLNQSHAVIQPSAYKNTDKNLRAEKVSEVQPAPALGFPCAFCPLKFFTQEFLNIHSNVHKVPRTPTQTGNANTSAAQSQSQFSNTPPPLYPVSFTGGGAYSLRPGGGFNGAIRKVSPPSNQTSRRQSCIHRVDVNTSVPVTEYPCPFCPLKFYTQKFLDNHSVIHSKDKPYACAHCPERFKYSSSLQLHQRIHTKSVIFACLECPSQFQSEVDLRIHQKCHQHPESWKCKFCTKIYATSAQVKIHQETEHGQPLVQEVPLIEEICPAAYVETEFSADLDDSVMESQTWNPPAASTVQPVLNSTESSAKFQCKFCGKPYQHSTALLTHERLHTGERPFECSYCQMKFRGKKNLRNHVEKRHPQGMMDSDVNFGLELGGDEPEDVSFVSTNQDNFVYLPSPNNNFKFEIEDQEQGEEVLTDLSTLNRLSLLDYVGVIPDKDKLPPPKPVSAPEPLPQLQSLGDEFICGI